MILKDPELQEQVKELIALGNQPIACKFLSDESETTSHLEAIGLDVSYVGEAISAKIEEGYVPMVW